MKKLIVLFSAVAALAACSKNEVVPAVSGENVEISYKVAPRTKADPQAFDTKNVFASWAYYLPNGKSWETNFKEAQIYIGKDGEEGATISYGNSVWKDQTTSYYWPKEGNLTFFAYSLNSSSLTDKSGTDTHFTCLNHDSQYGIFGTLNLDTHPNTDFLVADIASDKTANEKVYNFNGVPTLFKHKLSRVACTVKKAADYADKKFELKEINFLNVATYGSYGQLPTEAFTPGTVKHDQVYTNAVQEITTTAAAVAAEDVVIYMPQTFADATAQIQVKYTVTTTVGTGTVVENCVKEISIKDKFAEWAMGKKYTFNITFALDEITWDPAVEKWEDATAAGVTIQ